MTINDLRVRGFFSTLIYDILANEVRNNGFIYQENIYIHVCNIFYIWIRMMWSSSGMGLKSLLVWDIGRLQVQSVYILSIFIASQFRITVVFQCGIIFASGLGLCSSHDFKIRSWFNVVLIRKTLLNFCAIYFLLHVLYTETKNVLRLHIANIQSR